NRQVVLFVKVGKFFERRYCFWRVEVGCSAIWLVDVRASLEDERQVLADDFAVALVVIVGVHVSGFEFQCQSPNVVPSLRDFQPHLAENVSTIISPRPVDLTRKSEKSGFILESREEHGVQLIGYRLDVGKLA